MAVPPSGVTRIRGIWRAGVNPAFRVARLGIVTRNAQCYVLSIPAAMAANFWRSASLIT
jgi:hypothetical protein